MAAARPQQTSGRRQRILRIGVLLGGKIVEERLIRERVPVSLGQSMKNTFSIPVEGLPLEFTLFAIDEGKYSLRFLDKMDGRISDGTGQVHTLDLLKGRGATNAGGYWSIPIADSARGKLSIGDLTILFQFVTEPPRQPKPMLPASVRGTIADRIDPQLSVILGISIFIHFVVVIFALFQDLEVGGSQADRAYNLTFKQETYSVDLAPPEPPKPTDAGSAAGSAAEPDKKPETPKPETNKPSKPSTQPSKDQGGGRDTEDSVAMAEEEAAAFAAVMTSTGPDGKTEGDVASRRPGGDLGQQIDEVKESGKKVAIGGGSGRTTRGNGDPKLGTGTGPKIDAPGGTESAGGGKTTEKAPEGRIQVGQKQTFDDSTLTPDLVLQKIQSAYMSGLKRCYKTYLAKDASARGKVTLDLTVNESGRTVEGKASGFPAGEVNACISGLMGSWRFPVPKDGDGDPTTASFRIQLQLVPD